jgi:hypothetical protein
MKEKIVQGFFACWHRDNSVLKCGLNEGQALRFLPPVTPAPRGTTGLRVAFAKAKQGESK